MTDNTQTPKTDAASRSAGYAYQHEKNKRVVTVEFARDIERRLRECINDCELLSIDKWHLQDSLASAEAKLAAYEKAGEALPVVPSWLTDFTAPMKWSDVQTYIQILRTHAAVVTEKCARLEDEWTKAATLNDDQAARIAKLEAENAELRKNYDELIMAVARKFPNETRHQTALRYINQAESVSDKVACQAIAGGKDADKA